LDAIESVGTSGARVRIEHAEIIAERDIERIVRLGVPLVMQPNFVRNWGGEGGLYERRLGRERWERNNPFATLLRAGARVVLSSDGMPAGPLFGVKGASHHPIENQRIGAVDAVTRYTLAERTLWAGEPARGLAVGDPADVVILSGNPLLADLDGLRIISTFAAGRTVYEEAPPLWRKHLKSSA
jgi:predicted amidohydrolase YtcJ